MREMNRDEKHTAMLLALGPPPMSMSPTGRRMPRTFVFRAWESVAEDWLMDRDGYVEDELQRREHKHVIDDFIVWLGVKEMEELLGVLLEV